MLLRKFTALFCAFALALGLWACQAEPSSPASSAGKASGLESPDLGAPTPATVTERWKVCQVDEHSFLGYAQKEDGLKGELCSVSLDNVDETAGKLQPGAVVELVYDGCVLETWPGQIPGVESVTVVEQGEDIMTLYLKVLDQVYQEDPGLNPEGSMESSITYGFDLTGVQNLEQGEKETLAYLFTCAHDTDWEKAQPAGHVLGTYEELVEQGYIDGEKLSFENGLLFTIKDEPAKNGKFAFSVTKWRGGDGAIFYTECQAEKKDGQWDYELGGFAIS